VIEVGTLVRPGRGEPLEGTVVGISGTHYVCETPVGGMFLLPIGSQSLTTRHRAYKVRTYGNHLA